MERRDFLKAGLVLGGAAALGGCRLFPIPPSPGARTHSIIDGAPGDSGIDTVVICMMENRSFDSYLGWLARDDEYLEQGRKRYGSGFTVNGDQFQTYVDPLGNAVDTYRRVLYPGRQSVPWLRLRRPRARLDAGTRPTRRRLPRAGFAATTCSRCRTSRARTSRCTPRSARRFLVFDDWHASLLGPTYPNREYLLSAQSGGTINNDLPDSAIGFQWDTIVDRLRARGRLGCRLLQRPPAARALRPAHDSALPTDHPLLRRRRSRSAPPSDVRRSAPRRRAPQRRPSARRPARRAAVHPGLVLRVRALAALGARACSCSSTTSGAASSTTSRRRTSRRSGERRRPPRLQSGRVPGAGDLRFATRAARCRRPRGVRPHLGRCGSSNGASSARRRAVRRSVLGGR